MLACGAIAIALLGLAHAGLKDRFLYNFSSSVPPGLYLRDDEPLALGSFVTVRAVDVAADYARQRNFTDQGDRFIKRVAALAEVQICAQGDEVIVGLLRVERQTHDARGRVLPTWNGCLVLGADEVFLLGDTSDSFDSRYFGVVKTSQIEGLWRPL